MQAVFSRHHMMCAHNISQLQLPIRGVGNPALH